MSGAAECAAAGAAGAAGSTVDCGSAAAEICGCALGAGTSCSAGATASEADSVAGSSFVLARFSKYADGVGRVQYQSTKLPCRTVSASTNHTTDTSMSLSAGSHRRRDSPAFRGGVAGAETLGVFRDASTSTASRRVESNAVAGVLMPENLPVHPRQKRALSRFSVWHELQNFVMTQRLGSDPETFQPARANGRQEWQDKCQEDRDGHDPVDRRSRVKGAKVRFGRSAAAFPRSWVVYDDPSLRRTTQTVRARILTSSQRDHCDA